MSPLSSIKAQLRKFNSLVRIGVGLFRFLILLFAALFVYCIVDYSFILSPTLRILFLTVTVLCGIIWAMAFKFNPASELEKNAAFNGKLFASVSDYPAELGYSEELINKTREETAKLLNSINLTPHIKKKLKPLYLPSVVSLIILFVCLIFMPAPKSVWLKRFFCPKNNFFSLTLDPGNKSVFYGDSVTIKIKPEGINPSKIVLSANNEKYTLYKTLKEVFQTTLKITEDVSYYATLGSVATPPCKISVIVPPAISEFQLAYTYPAYTKIPGFTSPTPEISALYGTKISLSVSSNVELTSATINLYGSPDTIACKIDGKNLKADLYITMG